MSGYFGKRPICTSDVADFTDIQGYGSQPLFKRFDNIRNVVDSIISEEYRGFLASPEERDGIIYWYIDDWKEDPKLLDELPIDKKAEYERIKDNYLAAYRSALSHASDEDYQLLSGAIKYVNDSFIYCYDGKVSLVAWGMCPDRNKHLLGGSWIKPMEIKKKPEVPPVAQPQAEPPKTQIPDENPPFTEPEPESETTLPPEVPCAPKIPWYKRLWLWLKGNGCLKWLLWLLLVCLLVALILLLVRGCDDTSGNDMYNNKGPVSQVEPVIGNDGSIVDDNGEVSDIVDEEGNLPHRVEVPPIRGKDGTVAPIIRQPNKPDIIANRLNIYLEDDNADLDKWAKDFKQAYPSDDYKIIGYDPNVKMLQILIPEQERDRIREELPGRLPDQKFFVVDESIMILNSMPTSENTSLEKGWHLKAVRAKSAWQITKGKRKVTIAIIDDGIEVEHNMFKGRLYKAYNVFTQSTSLGIGSGHGTHVAALAAGSDDQYSSGASGIAPECRIMPVQVFDNGYATFSSVASGIMYAIHNGADVVNISLGPSFHGMDQLTIQEQRRIASLYLKNEEAVFRHIIRKANENNTILVFAAGNDNILTSVLPECRAGNFTVNVAACTPAYKAARFTNYSDGTNISAPGVGIFSAFPYNSYKMLDGTSMSAPIVSGAIALLKSVKPEITAEECVKLLDETGHDTDKYIPPMLLIDNALSSLTGIKLEHREDNLLEEIEKLESERDSIDNEIVKLKKRYYDEIGE